MVLGPALALALAISMAFHDSLSAILGSMAGTIATFLLFAGVFWVSKRVLQDIKDG